jgi:protein-tyrosine phosphatase
MPWPIAENLVLSAMPLAEHLDKYGWENIGMVTLCNKVPTQQVTLDERVQWWSHIPIADGQIKNMKAVIRARDTALSMLTAGHLTVIHCVAGRNRSGLVGALVVRELHNLTGAQAMDWTRRCRPRAIDNVYFETFLNSLGAPR